MSQRKIIHIDMDAFFASVEQRDFPELRGKPIAVGGNKERGVVAAASYEARKYGVRSAMPSKIAAQKCPHLIFVKHRFDVYKEVSQQIREIFNEYTDLVEPLSLDEAFLDVTENKLDMKSAISIARRIKEDILKETQLTSSAGVSYNKFLAKIASDYNKPDGLTAILPEKAQSFMMDLPIEKFFGVGQATARKMHRLRIKNGADLRQWNKLDLGRHFGKNGQFYYDIVRGIDDRPVKADRVRKSVSKEHTFAEDIVLEKEIVKHLKEISSNVASYMSVKEIKGKTVNIKVRFKNFETITRSSSFSFYTNDEKHITEAAVSLYKNLKNEREIRLLGVGMSNLDTEVDQRQLSLDL